MKHSCHWIKEPAKVGKDAIYCGKPVKYKMEKDDDKNSRRKYNTFCDEHQQLVDKENEE